jgi:uncharacterized protein YlxP (DUF503 family)
VHVGTCIVKLRLPENGSLKGKRQVSRSIIERVKNKFNVSIAEVEDQDLWQALTLGISCVSNSAPHANEILSKAVNFIENSGFDAELVDYEIEMVNAL